MNAAYEAEVDRVSAILCRHWEERKTPPIAFLTRTSQIVNAADRLATPLTEETQRKLDALYGYVVWGRVMYAAARVNPVFLGHERRIRRTVKREPPELSLVPC